MKPYNPIKAEEKIMNDPSTKDEQKFLDSFTLDKMITNEEARDVLVREKMVWNTSEFAEAYISQQEKLQTELETLKLKSQERDRDVARYFELIDNPMKNIHETSLEQKLSEYNEFLTLKEKLSKAGK